MRVSCPVLLFRDRNRLAELFYEWANENHVSYAATSVIGFLQINQLLDEDAIYEFLKKHGGVSNA